MRSISASGAEHGGHRSVVVDARGWPSRCPRALTASSAVVERQRAGGHQRAVLAEAVAHDHVRAHAVRGEQPRQREVGRQHGRLGDLGLQQLRLQPRQRFRVVGVGEDVGRQRLGPAAVPSPGRPRRTSSRDDRFASLAAQPACSAYCEPWPVYRNATLPGRAAADEDALRAQHSSAGRRVRGERLQRLGRPWPPARRRRRSRSRPAPARRRGPGRARPAGSAPGGRLGAQLFELRDDVGVGRAADHRGAAQRAGLRRGRARPAAACRRSRLRRPRRTIGVSSVAPVPPGHVLLEHGVEVGAAEPERAHAGDPRAARRRSASRAARC